ncbi:MAG: thiamine pyrophosphate-binding protein [Alphaproteobacteria bacterium]
MPKMSGARFLAEFLERSEVSHLFGVPAVCRQTMRELERHNRVARILTHSEKAAVYMADGYARASGRPGVCLAQKVGASNMAAGLRDPFLACTPLVAITGGATWETQNRHTYQQVEDLGAFAAVTKYTARVERVERLPDVLRQAFRAATSGTPGPVHIDLAGHQGNVELEEADLEVLEEARFQALPPFRPVAEAGALRAAAAELEAAERPIIVAGGGVRAAAAAAELVALAERLSIPVATSMNAKEVIPGNHPLGVGVVGSYSRESANRAVLEADLVFFVGSHTGSQVTGDWRLPRPGTAVVQLDINGEELGRHYPNRVSLMGDAKATLAALLEIVDGASAARRRPWTERVQALVGAWREAFAPRLSSDAVPIRPERICHELTAWLPADAILVADTGHAGMWSGGFIDLNYAGQGFLRAAGSLGWGVPAAIGAKLAAPERPVVLFTGDGGFRYHCAELETAVRWNVPVVVIVNNNRSLNQGIGKEMAARDGRLEGRHAEVWRFGDTDLAGLAQSLGAVGLRVEKPGELSAAFDQALGAGRPAVIDVVSDMFAEAPLAYLGEA